MCEVAERLEQIGRAEGRTEGKSEVICSMLSKGYSVEEIANITDLDINFVREVEAKNK